MSNFNVMRIILFLSIILLSNNSLGQYCWVQKASVSLINRYSAMGFDINGKGYVGCGYSAGSGTSDFWEYDPVLNAWTQKANYLGGNIWAGAGFSIGAKGYFTVGTTGSTFPTSTYEYDPATNSWTSKAAFPTTGRQDCFGFTANNNGFVVGGWRSGNYYNGTYRYNQATNSWTTQANFPGTSRDGLRGFVIGTDAYVGTGQANGVAFNDIYKYNSISNNWTISAPFPGLVRHSGSSFEMNGKGFMGNGWNTTYYNDFYEYTPSTNSWTMITPFPGLCKTYTTSFSLNNSGYITTGRFASSSFTNQTWQLIERPTATFSFTQTNCGQTITINNTSTLTSTFLWNFGDGSTSTLSNPIHNYSSPGNYTITLIAGNGSCSDTTTQTITVTTPTTSSFIATPDCNNGVTLTNNSTNASTYSLNWGDGNIQSSFSTQHQYLTTGTYTITLIAINGTCSDTTIQTITVTTPTTSSFIATPDCNNGVTLTNNSTNASTYSLNWGDGNIQSSFSTQHQYLTTGTYTITLIALNGTCSDTTTQTITVITPTTSSFIATPDCNNGVTLTNNSTNASTYSLNWGDGNIQSSFSTQHQYLNSGPYTITLISYGGICSDTFSITINIDTLPGSNINYTVNPCTNSVSFAATNSAISYFWNFGDGTTNNTSSSIHQFTQPGNYIITLVSSNNLCIDSTTVTINLSPSLNGFVNYSIGCDNTLIASGTPNTGVSYNWNFGNGASGSINPISYQYSQPGTYQLTLVINNGVCTDTTIETIVVDTLVAANFVSNTDCNQGVALVNNSTGASNYFLNWGDGNTQTSFTSNHQYTSVGNYQITLIASNGACADTTTTNVFINSSPIADIALTINECKDTVSFNSLFTANSYLWTFGDGSSSPLANPIHFYSSPGIYTIQLLVSNNTCYDSSIVTVNLTGMLIDSISATVSCDGLLTASSPSHSNWTYLWDFGDGNTNNQNSTNHLYSTFGTYLVSLTVSNGNCTTTISKSIEFEQPIDYSISQTIDTCSRSIKLNLLPTPITNTIWNFGDGSSSNSNSPSHTYAVSGSYNVQVIINPNSFCSDTLNVNIDFNNTGSLDDIYLPNCFTPNNDLINDNYVIEYLGCGEIKATIFNRWGNIIYLSSSNKINWNGTHNKIEAPEGVYFILLESNNKRKASTITLLR